MPYDKLKSEFYQNMGGINSKVSPYMNGPMEFRDLSNVNFITPGALTKRQGSTLYLGATLQGQITGGVEFERLSGASYIIVTANTNIYTVTNTFNAFKTGLQNGAIFDFVTFVDRLFCCNGTDFFKTDTVNSSFYSLPEGLTGWGATATVGGTLTTGVTTTFLASYGYINDRGYIGPAASGITIILDGVTHNSITYFGLTTPSGYGVTAIQLYRSSGGGVDLIGTTTLPVGSTSFVDLGITLTTIVPSDAPLFTLAPKYMEIYNNQLFLAGISGFPSTVFWSEIGEPEAIDPDFNAEFRTNDGDVITGLKSYNGSLVVTKQRSFHRVTGDNPDNFFFQELSDQYGCLSRRAMVVYENVLWFLDPKGIVEYNGANIEVISSKIEPIFNRMNVPAAVNNAWALHVRLLNEVWFAIPVDGSTLNNMIVVYDYVSEAWTKYEGVFPSHGFLASGTLNVKTPFFGSYVGSLSYFGASLTADNGQGITCLIDPHFLSPSGETTERQYRRFYMNLEPIVGFTQSIQINFRTNYGSSVLLTRTIFQNPYQTRLDFGLSARTIQAEMMHYSATLPFKMYGFSFESRLQRLV